MTEGDRGEAARSDEVYRTLLESTRAIPWRIDWATKRFTYIGPQIGPLLGFAPESWVSVNDWAERIHPDDRERVVNFCVSQSQAGSDHEADYRALTADGDYLWIRDVVHVIRGDRGEVEALVGFMFDISERKETEQQLARLRAQLEELSFTDGLTGVANRRMFDRVLAEEWLDARRQRRPLSLILVDIDYFKQYNDHYGHLAGDDCLKRVATALGAAATRPRDLLARYGGEEFALILPETDLTAARHVAERCRQRIFREQIPHASSAASGVITISLGLSSLIPTHGDTERDFLERVDRLLYRAKQDGRNRIVGA
jgi:diguanylate cyclase (GGDEF)-like protein/PAS domain S-box-containing protein